MVPRHLVGGGGGGGLPESSVYMFTVRSGGTGVAVRWGGGGGGGYSCTASYLSGHKKRSGVQDCFSDYDVLYCTV